jgi:hypothetical protein
MPVARTWEEDELAPELQRIYADMRASFDVPFVPDLFKLLSGTPEYLRVMWSDLGAAARSREFQAADKALEEFVRWVVVSGSWRFSDQQRVLAGQHFSTNDVEQLVSIATTFARLSTRLSLFARLMQKGYSGGQTGRIGNGRQASALARLVTLHVPDESAASLRVWLIYADIKRTLGVRQVFSLYRVMSPFPPYLASVWLDSKRIFREPAFLQGRDQTAKRANGLVTGIPVKDHRASARQLDPKQWQEIEQHVDNYARLMPLFALLSVMWQRSLAVAGPIAA